MFTIWYMLTFFHFLILKIRESKELRTLFWALTYNIFNYLLPVLEKHELVIISYLFATLPPIYVINVPLLGLSLLKSSKPDNHCDPLLAHTILRIQNIFRAKKYIFICLLVNNCNPGYLCICLFPLPLLPPSSCI